MIKNLHIFLLLALVSCVGTKVEEKITTGNINALAPYLWNDKSFPKIISISNDFTVPEVTNITDMSTAWQSSVHNTEFFRYTPGKATEVSNNVNNLNSLLDDTMGIYKTSSWHLNLPRGALAVTQIFGRRYNTGSSSEFVNIEHADILVNYQWFTFHTSDSDRTAGSYDLQTVILHEMGHFLGLQHNSSVSRSQTVMYPSISNTEPSKRVPQLADTNDLANKYGIFALGGTGGSALASKAPTGFVANENQPNEAIKIIIELHADGSCVHKENGKLIEQHQVSLK